MPRLLSFVSALFMLAGIFAAPAAADDRSVCFNANTAPDTAIEACGRMISSGLELAKAYEWRGYAYRIKGDRERAIADYSEAIRIEPNANRYAGRAIAHSNKGDYDRAIADLNEAIRLDPKMATAYNNRGLAYRAKGEYDRAIRDFDEAIQLRPSAVHYVNRGVAYKAKGEDDRAIRDFDEAIQLDPKYSTAYNERGVVYGTKGDYDRAIRDFDEAIRLDPKHPAPYTNRGQSYYHKGNYDRAIRDFDEAIRLDPKFAEDYRFRGLSYSQKGDYDRAIRDFDEAIRLDPKMAGAYGNRGAAYEAKNELAKALIDFRTAVALKPNDKYASEAVRRLEQKLAVAGVKPETVTPPISSPAVTPLPADTGRRIALVIGNDRYPNLPADKQLAKAVNDARAVGDALEKLGFTVIRGENLDRNGMVDRIHTFTQQLREGDMAVVFFAGHGVALGGGNYILPTDVPLLKPGEEQRMRNRAIGEADLIADIQEKKARVAVLLLDACRDNPFRQPGILRTVGGERGLARGQQAEGVFAVYSAGFGQSALDSLGAGDASPNSVFTRVLVPALARADAHLSDLIIDMRQEVTRLARTIGHQQTPAYYDQTTGGRIYLAPRPR